jgi:hypothetical protein
MTNMLVMATTTKTSIRKTATIKLSRKGATIWGKPCGDRFEFVSSTGYRTSKKLGEELDGFVLRLESLGYKLSTPAPL